MSESLKESEGGQSTESTKTTETTHTGAEAFETIADIGELALIERLKGFCAAGAIGDDAALMAVQPGHKLVVTTDMLTDGVHFSDRTTPPYSVGWRATAANLSDLAAMGAKPKGITVSLGLPKQTPWLWVKELYQGIADCLKNHGGEILGGDLCRCAQRTISMTALGEVRPERAIYRHTATAGQVVVVTGAHGASRAGLALLLNELDLAALEGVSAATDAAGWIERHQRPVPRLDAIDCLRRLIETDGKSPDDSTITGMDSSDGLANALLQISHSSGVGMDVLRSHIPLPPGLSAAIGPETALEWALYGGEDFELVLCLPVKLARAFVATGFATAIGTTTDTGIVQLLSSEANALKSVSAQTLTYKDFQHF
jgi:thiamine-monophosphate kinase